MIAIVKKLGQVGRFPIQAHYREFLGRHAQTPDSIAHSGPLPHGQSNPVLTLQVAPQLAQNPH